MISIKVDFTPKLASINEAAIQHYLKAVLVTTRATAIQMIESGGRSGRHYPRLPNRSSAPGEPPKTQSGRLATSMTIPEVSGREGSFGEAVHHAAFLEFGTPGGKIAPRPHLRPALKQTLNNVNLPDNIVTWK